jgi:cation diffusion facilitator CzcD-associated flavoprotein CzcO
VSFVKVQRVAIIGAGVAGLATARQLIARGIECTVFERTDRLGGVWAAGYAGFGDASSNSIGYPNVTTDILMQNTYQVLSNH